MALSTLKMFWQEEDGQDLIEYSLLLAFIALAAVTILSSAGASLRSLFTTMNTSLTNANAAATSGQS